MTMLKLLHHFQFNVEIITLSLMRIFSYFNFQVNYKFYFTLRMKSQSIACLLSGSERYILDFGPWSRGALNMGFVDKATFKCKGNYTLKWGMASIFFQSCSVKTILVCPMVLCCKPWPLSYQETPPKKACWQEVSVPHYLGLLHTGPQVPSHLRVNPCNLDCWEHGSWDLPLYIGSQVLSPKYNMDAYMATLIGGEAWDLCWELNRPNN